AIGNGNGGAGPGAQSSPVPVARPRGAGSPAVTADEAPPAAGSLPIPTVAEGAAGSLWISFAPDLSIEALLDAIESVTTIVRRRPGTLPVVLAVPVAGATRQVRLPQATGWDEELEAVLRREVPAALSVERRLSAVRPGISSGP
ncbi:MAG TPA: hypothetical protein VGA91_02430, partial [Candidatus Limnocylindria bacterium]